MGWADTETTGVNSRFAFLDELAQYTDPGLSDFIAKEKIRLGEYVKIERGGEHELERDRDESFE